MKINESEKASSYRFILARPEDDLIQTYSPKTRSPRQVTVHRAGSKEGGGFFEKEALTAWIK
jgi:hypothetical protein